MNPVRSYTEKEITFLTETLGEVIKGPVEISMTVKDFDPHKHEFSSMGGALVYSMADNVQDLRRSLENLYGLYGKDGYVSITYQKGDYTLGWAELYIETGEMSYFRFEGILTVETTVGYCGNFIEKGAQIRLGLDDVVPNIRFFNHAFDFKQLKVQKAETYVKKKRKRKEVNVSLDVPSDHDHLKVFMQDTFAEDFFKDNFSSEAIVSLGRELATYTSSDVGKHFITDDQLKEIIRLANNLSACAKLALDIREFKNSLD